jgi:hypothetical protein
MYATPEKLQILDDIDRWIETVICTDTAEYNSKANTVRHAFIEVVNSPMLEERSIAEEDIELSSLGDDDADSMGASSVAGGGGVV